jgi:hypothetical protein
MIRIIGINHKVKIGTTQLKIGPILRPMVITIITNRIFKTTHIQITFNLKEKVKGKEEKVKEEKEISMVKGEKVKVEIDLKGM